MMTSIMNMKMRIGTKKRKRNETADIRYCLLYTSLEVLTAQQTLLNAELTQVANRFTEMQGVINLYQALGGGRD